MIRVWHSQIRVVDKASFAVINFNCHVSANNIYNFISVIVRFCLKNICNIDFSFVTANYVLNGVSQVLKCFSFWGTSSPRPLTGFLPLNPTDSVHWTPAEIYQIQH